MVSHHIFVFPFLVPLTKKGENVAIWGSTCLVLPLLFFPLGQKLFIAAAQKERKKAGREGANEGGEHNTLYKSFSLSIISLTLYERSHPPIQRLFYLLQLYKEH